MAAVAGLLSWCAFDLFSRASDPYRIYSRKSPATSRGDAIATRPDGIVPFAAPGTLSAFPARAGHHVAPTPVADLSEQGPFGIQSSRDTEVHYGPVTAYTSQPNRPRISSSIATRDQEQEVSPAPGRIERPSANPTVQITREKRDGHSRATRPGQWVKVEISTYSRSYHGNGTHSGERYDHYKGHTAATTIIGRRWVLPKGSTWEVEYLGKTITVRINDTGSWRPKRARYWLDLSGRAWSDLTGIAPSRKVARMRRVR